MRAGKKVKQRERHRKDEAGKGKREKVADRVELARERTSIDGVVALSIFRYRVGMSAYQLRSLWRGIVVPPLFFSFFSYLYHGLPRLKHIFSKAASFLRSIVVLLRFEWTQAGETRSIFSGIKILRTPGGCLKVEETTCRTDGSISSNSSSAQQAAGAISRTISPQFVTGTSSWVLARCAFLLLLLLLQPPPRPPTSTDQDFSSFSLDSLPPRRGLSSTSRGLALPPFLF
ncbi:hypothetical protein ALC57_13071 [Trachymyrmex cornetzi]|uniref:Uncharacterized protein n=1 Tax=Trachymyrmex cornetzi TaxID=471704 RepID=A0A195DPB5_9HYME|nr:hypothetical protein ALC57_13071 [Trachymyrmex cornetzi]